MLPCHGKIDCNKCYNNMDRVTNLNPLWKMKNDPGAWGSSKPEVLILGFSKGSTQANIYENGNFNDIAFGGPSRSRLDQALKCVGLLQPSEHVTDMISNNNSKMAFGSLVRCSLSREDKNGKHACSGALINKSFKEIPEILNNCVSQHIAVLPEETKLIIMLGVSEAYIKNCRHLLSKIGDIEEINAVSYKVNNKMFVHLTHPSPANGHFNAWIEGGNKQKLAKLAINKTMTL